MYDPTFGPTSLNRHIRKTDFKDKPKLKTEAFRNAQIAKAVNHAKSGLKVITLEKNDLSGRAIYKNNDLPTELVLRKAVQNIRKISSARQSSRLDIIQRLQLLCREGMPFTVAKFDVKQFYPSVDQASLKGMVQRRLDTAPGTRTVLDGFITACAAQGIHGVPPGLAISAALGEMYMQDFDASMQSQLKPHLYARYVDDIILVLPPTKDLKGLLEGVSELLPPGLCLNEKKTRLVNFAETKAKAPAVEHQFDYLGFSFSVSEIDKDRPNSRKVVLDVSDNKVKKRKTRVARSLLQYLKDGEFGDLRDRFRVNSCNYKFFDTRKSRVRSAGMYHTYGLIDLPSKSLKELDAFQRKILLSTSGKICGPLSLSLPLAQRNELLTISFEKAFIDKTHFHFTPERLKFLMECWKYA